MAGAGTKDEMLLRIITMRCDFDLGAVKNEYQRMYGKPLSKAVTVGVYASIIFSFFLIQSFFRMKRLVITRELLSN